MPSCLPKRSVPEIIAAIEPVVLRRGSRRGMTRRALRGPLHFAVPVFGLRVDGAENFHVPFAAAPRLDHLGRDDVHEDFGEEPALRVALQMVGRVVPPEIRVQQQGQKQVVAVVDDDQLAAGAFDVRVVNEVFLGAVRADVPFEREFARHDFLDRDLLVPAVAAVFLLAARLGDFFGAAQRAPGLDDRLPWHILKV